MKKQDEAAPLERTPETDIRHERLRLSGFTAHPSHGDGFSISAGGSELRFEDGSPDIRFEY